MVVSRDLCAEQFDLFEELGSGSFGVVYKAIEKATGKTVAIKLIDLERAEDDVSEIQQEITVLSDCSSPYVTSYLGSFVKGYKLWIIMEYIGGGSCLDLLDPGAFSEQHIAIICRELLLGLTYLHEEGKMHRDIKAANILLTDEGHLKIADFGVATHLVKAKSLRNTFVGTPFWMAPEVISQSGYDTRADIWSVGITAMEMAYGEPPRSAIHPMKVLFVIPKEPAPRLEGPKWSNDFKNFVDMCLQKQACDRATAQDLLKTRFIRNAGKVEQLQELVERKRQWRAGQGRFVRPKMYSETIRPSSRSSTPDVPEEQWDFDTLKPQVRIHKGPLHAHQNVFLRKSEPESRDTPEVEAMKRLDIRASKSPEIKESRVASTSPTSYLPSSVLRSPTKPIAPITREEVSRMGRFGNSVIVHEDPSTVRRRPASLVQQVTTPKPLDRTPSSVQDKVYTTKPPNSEQDLLGRLLFGSAAHGAFQEIYKMADTIEEKEITAQVAKSWAALDAISPEMEWKLMLKLIEHIKAQPQLQQLLLPETKLSEQPPPCTSPQKASYQVSNDQENSSPQIKATKIPSKIGLQVTSSPLPASPRRSTPNGQHARAKNIRANNHKRSQSTQVPQSHARPQQQQHLQQNRLSQLRPLDTSANLNKGGHKRHQSQSTASGYSSPQNRAQGHHLPQYPPYLKLAPTHKPSIEDVQMTDVWENQQQQQVQQQQAAQPVVPPQSQQVFGGQQLGSALYSRWIDGLRARWPESGEKQR